jgi:hypothetical protein
MIIVSALRLFLKTWTEARDLERRTLANFPYLLD